jgi:predicted 3-demethylubiquinone-9 3-methyltransferase (glyoxalase superfamily)
MSLPYKITPYLWFDAQAKEAAALYTGLFTESRVLSITTLPDTPSGDVDTVALELCGQPFMFMSAGPLFKFTPAISFRVECPSLTDVEALYSALVEGGSTLMPLGSYPFSERFAWLEDRYGVSWQLMWDPEAPRQQIVPILMFVGAQCGKAEAALRAYAALFPGSSLGEIQRYGPAEAPDTEGTVKQAAFTLAGRPFRAMDSAHAHAFTFNEAISLMVYCDDQAEIDRYWTALSAVPEAEQCGWLKDQYGVSWQIVPRAMDAMLADNDPTKVARVTQAFLPMKKLDLAALQRAYDN